MSKIIRVCLYVASIVVILILLSWAIVSQSKDYSRLYSIVTSALFAIAMAA